MQQSIFRTPGRTRKNRRSSPRTRSTTHHNDNLRQVLRHRRHLRRNWGRQHMSPRCTPSLLDIVHRNLHIRHPHIRYLSNRLRRRRRRSHRHTRDDNLHSIGMFENRPGRSAAVIDTGCPLGRRPPHHRTASSSHRANQNRRVLHRMMSP